jgi:HlyD family secretion protein
MKRPSWLPAAIVVLAAASAAAWWFARSSDDAPKFRTAKIEQGELQAIVAAGGTVNAVRQVIVGSQVSGQIKELFADFNTEVKQGQLIARIDPESIRYRVRQAQADLDAARAQALQGQAGIAVAQAALSRARLDADNAERDRVRKQELLDKQFISAAEFESVRNVAGTLAEQLKVTQAQLEVSRAQADSAQATVQQRAAALAQAQVDLDRTEIRSPVAGVVIKRSVDVGQTVAASLQAPELFIIARNLSDMQVEAAIDEADIGRVKTGQPASFTVDAFPARTFEGQVATVRKAALNTNNVVTYTVVVVFSNGDADPGLQLLPGMTANVRIVTDVRQNALKLPNPALRVRLPGVAEPAGPAPGTAAVTGSAAPPMGANADAGASNSRASAAGRGRVYVLGADGKPQAVAVRLGITDGNMTELLSSTLEPGQEVIVGLVGPAAGNTPPRPAGGPRPPF